MFSLSSTKLLVNLIYTVALSLAFGCLQCAGADSPRPLPVRSLAKGVFSGIRDARKEVLRKAGDWEKLWSQHSVSAGATEKIPAVDFDKEMVIAATLGTQRTGGYSIEVVGVEARGKTLRISIKKSAPPPGAITIQALTAPFHFVAVPKSDLKPQFVDAAAEKRK
ncbi:MAG: protease complex subunit PrcB family protein [Verrucomicrobia bacterium]|nr:MAG: protease complex subunit PrcB family protein [Verrucomicrobiota bacterium]